VDGGVLAMLLRQLCDSPAAKGAPAGEELVQDQAESVDVTAGGDLLARELLG
jgi:hypothetical protein